jgi:DnaJ-class molecular chaperone
VGAVPLRTGGIIDLPSDMQGELRALEARGARVSHYELLGVAADADHGAVRRAYLEKSKKLHPDAWYGKELGEFGPLLSKWFQKLSTAYQTLVDEESRAEYDKAHRADLSATDRVAVQRRELSHAEEERREREGRERLLRSKGFARLGAARKL